MNSYIVVLAALLAVAAADYHFKRCPRTIGKYPFDEAKFAGEWNAVAYLPNGQFDENRCTKLSVSSFKGESGTTLNYKLTYILDGKNKAGEVITFSKGDKGAVAYATYKKDETSNFTAVYKQAIVATDYDTYAVFVACRPTFNEESKEFGRDLHATILSRTTTLPEEKLKTLKSLLTSYDIEYDSIKRADSSC
ncbi:apolipoprotein D-like [Cloeon dipterum]|uniref:apolipoprotein D-like n=1 Tax=Cloeon dipterum TaxID=197152 RepID=UPI00321F728E